MGLQEKYKTLFNSYHINTPLRIAHFMAQIDHESGLKPISENLNYSSTLRLKQIFGKYFKGFSNYELSFYVNKAEVVANIVYSDRMGNGNSKSGDGWKYRGRGFLQITGKDNYIVLSKDTRIDFVNNPDLLLEEANALVSALWFWNKNKLNDFADNDDIIGITKKINGGLNGIEHRKELLNKYKK
jgi:putative chitinase